MSARAPSEYPYLRQRMAFLDVAQALADVDDPGCWWTLTAEARARYEAMATVALDLIGDHRADADDEFERARHYGFREALQLVDSAMRVMCLDCDENTIELGEYYMLNDDVWLEANPARIGMLCIGCVETRLGRTLQPGDFTMGGGEGSSPRRQARVLGLEEAPAA